MNYEEYQAYIICNQEAMKETRRMQQAEQFKLEQDINERFADAKRRYIEELKSLRSIQRDRAYSISEKWKAERMRLHLSHAKIIEQWREQNKIPPPYIEQPAGEQQHN